MQVISVTGLKVEHIFPLPLRIVATNRNLNPLRKKQRGTLLHNNLYFVLA